MASKPHHDAEADAISRKENPERYTFKPRAFNIVWGNDSRYWRIPPRSALSSASSSTTSNVEEFAELVQVSWLEVTGSVPLEASTNYQITFKLSFKGDASGWSGSPVFLMAKVGKKGKYKWKRLKELENLPRQPTEVPNEPFVVEVLGNPPDKRLYFGLYEVWTGKWKKGLRVHEAIVKKKT
ncbi:protein PHLOEM PROTEIN 2-LIKE A9-like [Durio zibethinus]|uniref:Protein PHLOEM PROTEIN 2-LIKE A9-like n=1 Tax=Durio zibethinus TaxID=66656 RepID=A0A6P5WYG9_DURZI|nr:protein PHLOEM PROTEIN 2-LIKE A9-like [Durio zibethinus]